MDSLTQITLGAAVGEAVLGKKVGSRAMLWGAIGGTIPDLDVFANFVTDEISALAFHRAITHAFAFAALAPVVMGFLIHRLYARSGFGQAVGWAALALFGIVAIGSIGMPVPPWEVVKVALAIMGAILFFPVLAWGIGKLRAHPPRFEAVGWKAWSWLFFWAIFTHPLLDACTTYGTQLFRPFFSYRVAFNNISVADPVYTLPFLLLLLAALVAGRKRQKLRTALNVAGLVVSSIYLLFTFYHKHKVNAVFASSFEREQIEYHRFMTAPTILNNLLWQGIAEGDTAFYHGLYSVLDAAPKVETFTTIPKNHHLLDSLSDSRDVQVLQWFSDGYYSVLPLDDGRLQFNDLRFGALRPTFDSPDDFVFGFILQSDEQGQLRAQQRREQPEDAGGALRDLWERMLGI